MKITYKISKKDFAAYIKFFQRRVSRLARFSLGLSTVFGMILGIMLVPIDRLFRTDFISELLPAKSNIFQMLFVFIVVICLGYLYLKVRNHRLIPMMASEGGLLLGDFSLELDSDGFVVTNQLYQTKYTWEAVQGVEENEGYIIIILDICMGVAIPENAFSSPQEKNDFFELIASRGRINGDN